MQALAQVVTEALAKVPLTDADQAAAELARQYAEAIDSGQELISKAGPALLACLEALGMTPRARKALVKEATDAPASPLDELRKRRAARTA